MTSPVSPWKAAALLCRLNWRRQINRLGSMFRLRKPTPGRPATARKPAAGRLLTALVAASMLYGSFNLAHQGMANLTKAVGSVETFEGVGRGWLGVALKPVTEETATRLGIPPHGALISGVTEHGPAQAAGLDSGDVIVELDGKAVNEPAELAAIVAEAPAGSVIPVVILHDGRPERMTVTLGRRAGQQRSVRPIPLALGSILAPGVIKGAGFVSTLLLLSALLLALARRDLAQPEWDLEWLATLPLPLSTLLSGQLIERAATNSIGFVVLVPFLSMVAWGCGYVWTAPLLGLGLAAALLFAVATVQMMVDTGLRLSMSPPQLRNLQAVISLVAVAPLLPALAMGLHADSSLFGWIAALPDWIIWLPPGLAVRALASSDVVTAARWYAAMAGEVVVFVAIGGGLLSWQLRHGVVAAGAREAGGRGPAAARRSSVFSATWSRLPVVQRRELRLLARDRAFLVQTLLVPVVMVGLQIVLNAGASIFADAVEHPAILAWTAFALAAYTLMYSAFQTLSTEGPALWILFSLPQKLETVLWQKAKLWAVAAAIYPLLIFACASALSGAMSLQFAGAALIVLLGVPIFSVIATALGVLGFNPLARQEARPPVRVTFAYLYMTLVGLYGYAISAITVWQRAIMVILTTLLAAALWQKARDQFDYLLDPAAAPPSRVSVSDGMIAALMFFVLQLLVAVLFKANGSQAAPATVLWVAFTLAGATTTAALQLAYWLAGTTGIPRVFNGDLAQALKWGVAGGLVASVVGVIYLEAITAMHLLPSRSAAPALGLIAVAVVAAPLFEEFIFRGLIFGGLRRTLGPAASVLASAAIFAMVHPPLSVIPVFVMGACAALIYQRTKVLAAPMLVHAIYNAAVVGWQWGVMP